MDKPIVYDIEGNMYELVEKCSNGYVVTEIKICRSYCDGDYYEKSGDTVILKEIFIEPPVQKKLEEVKQLEDKLTSLKFEVKTLTAERKKMLEKSEADIIKEKLSKFPTVLKLIDKLALIENVDKSDKIYFVSDWSNEIEEYNGMFLCVNPFNGDVRISDNRGNVLNDSLEMFFSIEDAEIKQLENIKTKSKCTYSYNFDTVSMFDLLFKKHNVIPPSWWDELKETCKAKKIADLEEAVSDCKQEIADMTDKMLKCETKIQQLKGE